MFSETTSISPFFATYSFQPCLGIEPYNGIQAPPSRDAKDFAIDIEKILLVLKAKTALVQSYYEDSTNQNQHPAA